MTEYSLYRKLFEPLQTDGILQRREFMVNVILAGLVVIAGFATLISGVHVLRHGNEPLTTNSVVSNVIFTLLMIGAWYTSRRGHYRPVAYIIVCILALATIQLTLTWSFELPIAVLLYALTIVIAGVLLPNKAIAGSIIILSAIQLAIAYGQISHRLHPHTDWVQQSFEIGDVIGYIVIFCIMALISWLANREIEHSLSRAQQSEAEVMIERDSLEGKVKERTRQLEEAQLVRLIEQRRFAEFGRLSANLLHEIANPLTAASLNLEQFGSTNSSKLVRQARSNLSHLERYLQAARQQINGSDELTNFKVRHEVSQVVSILTARARTACVTVHSQIKGTLTFYGNAVKFSQIITNLLANAIDASRENQSVQLDVVGTKAFVTITVTDHGSGINSKALPHIFDPFFTTKKELGIGIGLAMVKQFVEDDFQGTISVTSDGTGTQFTAILRSAQQQ